MTRVYRGERGRKSATERASYLYDPTGLRVSKTAGGKTTYFVYGIDGNELAEISDTGSLETLWALGKKIAEIETRAGADPETSYLATDHLGSVVAVTDETGRILWTGEQGAFGEAVAGTGLRERAASYTGKDWDEEAGLYYFNARWYDPSLGRFTTEDPIKDSGNWYAYVSSRPLTATDPTGLRTFADDPNKTTTAEREYNAREADKRKVRARENAEERERKEKQIDARDQEILALMQAIAARQNSATGSTFPGASSKSGDEYLRFALSSSFYFASNFLDTLGVLTKTKANGLLKAGKRAYWSSSGEQGLIDDAIHSSGNFGLVLGAAEAAKAKGFSLLGQGAGILGWGKTGKRAFDLAKSGNIIGASSEVLSSAASASTSGLIIDALLATGTSALTSTIAGVIGGGAMGLAVGAFMPAAHESIDLQIDLSEKMYGARIDSGKMSPIDWLGYSKVSPRF